jgi:dihydroxyacetone kinase-like protein
MIDADAMIAFFDRVLLRTQAAQAELDRLDAVAGDGDHGVTMVLGWRRVSSELVAAAPLTPGETLRNAAAAFADVGGSAGPLWGTALLRAGRTLGDVRSVELSTLASAAAAAAQGMRDRGRCGDGDRTVVDAMAPAAAALEAAARVGAPVGAALADAAAAAAAGAAATALLAPRRGRATRAPLRVRGHEDPGARAAAVFWSAAAIGAARDAQAVRPG